MGGELRGAGEDALNLDCAPLTAARRLNLIFVQRICNLTKCNRAVGSRLFDREENILCPL